MISLESAQAYINYFRSLAAPSLKPGSAIAANLYLAGSEGGIVVFHFTKNKLIHDRVHEGFSTLHEALKTIPQRAFGGNLEGFRFGGTNTIVEGDRVIFIKDANPSQWSLEAAKHDATKVVDAARRRAEG